MRLVYGLLVACLVFGLFIFPVLGISSSSGSAPGFSGGIAESGATCQVCHSSFDVNEGTGAVWVEAPDEYMPGQSYAFVVGVDNTTEPEGDDPIQGFQISVQDTQGEHVGELLVTDPTHTRFAGTSPHYITHTTVGRFQSVWTLEWIAPDGDDAPDEVTLFVTGNAAAGNSTPMGDYIYAASTVLPRGTKSAEPEGAPRTLEVRSVFPNPARSQATFRIEVTKGTSVTLHVLDGLGREVRESLRAELPVGEHDLQLNLNGLATGLYFVRVTTPDGVASRPLQIVN